MSWFLCRLFAFCHFLCGCVVVVVVVVQHILGVTVTHQDMEAIDPDYYKNLLQITTLPLEDLGLDLTFSADTEMFGACRPSRSFVPFPPPGVEVSLAIPSPGGHVPVEQLSSLLPPSGPSTPTSGAVCGSAQRYLLVGIKPPRASVPLLNLRACPTSSSLLKFI